MDVTVVGIDCATLPEKTGLTFAAYRDGTLGVYKCALGKVRGSVAEVIAPAVRDTSVVLLAFDSPLGWPASLGRTLSKHNAGEPIEQEADLLFRRITDKVVRQVVGKTPLEVGADRIARTAVSALNLLRQLRELTGSSIQLASDSKLSGGLFAIEVYPAGLLRAYEQMTGERGPGSTIERKRRLVDKLKVQSRIHFDEDFATILSNDHVLDSLLCTVAAADFLEGNVVFPTTPAQKAAARKEGWIWVRDPRVP